MGAVQNKSRENIKKNPTKAIAKQTQYSSSKKLD